MATIPTKNGRSLLVDDQDVGVVKTVHFKDGTSIALKIEECRWFWVGTGSRRHAAATIGRKTVYIHRAVMEAPATLQVDHIDRDTANNGRANLRLATHGQNLVNQSKPRRRACQYRGVRVRQTPNGPRYFSTVKKDRKSYATTSRASQEEAARDHDALALRLFGEFAVLNFPQPPKGTP